MIGVGAKSMQRLLKRNLNFKTQPINSDDFKRRQGYVSAQQNNSAAAGMKHPYEPYLSWVLSNTIDTDFCIEALKKALHYGKPGIFNTDQGSQFTSQDFTGALLGSGISVSMDGKGRVFDNIFVERLWRTVKYENIYINGYSTIPEANAGLTQYFKFYNMERYHQSLNYSTPWKVYNGEFSVC